MIKNDKIKVIFISGPSGSGKTTLSDQILVKIKNGIVLGTDNYYKTGLISKFLSKFVKGYFDKSISFNYKLFKKDFDFIIKNGISIHERSYNFKNKSKKIFTKKTNNIKFLIIEGIFAKECSINLYDPNYFFIELKINKIDCMNRVIGRDLAERGKNKKQAKEDFLKSWDIYYEKFKYKRMEKKTNEFLITKKTKIDSILKKIFNLKY